jgi:hypothetical protein
MHEQIVDAGGVPTHLLVYGKQCRNNTCIVVIPGNPGSALFYCAFASELHSSLDTMVVVVGHSGHFVSPSLPANRYQGLEGQVRHKRCVLTLLMDRHGTETKFVLCAHSIGSWMAMELVVDMHQPLLPIVKVCHLMPTLRHLYLGMTIGVRVAIHPWVTMVVANVVHYTPRIVRDALIWLFGHDTDEVKLVLTDHLDYYTVRNVLCMAAEEAQDVVEPRQSHINELCQNVDRHYFVFSQIDHYVPLSYVAELKHAMGDYGSKLHFYICDKDVEHAFVIGHSKEVAQNLIGIISPLLDAN